MEDKKIAPSPRAEDGDGPVIKNHRTKRESDKAELDLAVAYVLGETTDEERHGFESALATGDKEANSSYSNATRSIDELTGVLPPEAPPAFAKDRVMARVREDNVTYFVPPPQE